MYSKVMRLTRSILFIALVSSNLVVWADYVASDVGSPRPVGSCKQGRPPAEKGGTPKPKDCSDCVFSTQYTEVFCESRGQDCDGLQWINESYRWERVKLLYQCPPEMNWYVRCMPWVQSSCCNDGSTGLPPTYCTHTGATRCIDR